MDSLSLYRDTAASRVAVDVMPTASLPFYRTLLEREQRFHRHLPSWFLPQVILSTTAIAVTFYTSARFAHTAVFFAVMTWIIIGAAVALVIGLRKSGREADRCQREMDELAE